LAPPSQPRSLGSVPSISSGPLVFSSFLFIFFLLFFSSFFFHFVYLISFSSYSVSHHRQREYITR
jgi:hypothetical protein